MARQVDIGHIILGADAVAVRAGGKAQNQRQRDEPRADHRRKTRCHGGLFRITSQVIAFVHLTARPSDAQQRRILMATLIRLIEQASFLRRVLLADASASAASGVLLIVGANMLEPLLGVSADLLRWSGISFLPFATLVAFLATRESLSRA